MCGQLGYSSAKNNFDIEKFKILALWNSLERGVDATGIYSPKNGLKTTLKKGSQVIIDHVGEIKGDKMVMAHFRAATVGDKTNLKNVHPFCRGNYVLQHNGTIQNYYDLLRKYSLKYADYNVDSDIICGSIDACGNIAQVLSEIKGPAAIIITKKDDPYTMYVFRNSERPLFKGLIGGDMYISSIEDSLKLIGCTHIKSFEENFLYTIKDGLIKDKVKIANTPYQHVQVNTATTPSTLFRKIATTYLSLGSWMRASYDVTYKDDGFKIVKGEYYCIQKVIDDKFVTVYCPRVKKSRTVSFAILNINDLIDVNDVCRLTKDFINKNNKVCAKAGDLVKVTMSYGDGEACVYNWNTNVYIGMVLKINMVKVYPVPIKEPIVTVGTANNTLVVVNKEEEVEAEEVEEEEVKDLPLDLHVNSDSLCEMFGEYNSMILNLKNTLRGTSMKVIEQKLAELIEFNFSNYNEYIVEPEKELENGESEKSN